MFTAAKLKDAERRGGVERVLIFIHCDERPRFGRDARLYCSKVLLRKHTHVWTGTDLSSLRPNPNT